MWKNSIVYASVTRVAEICDKRAWRVALASNSGVPSPHHAPDAPPLFPLPVSLISLALTRRGERQELKLSVAGGKPASMSSLLCGDQEATIENNRRGGHACHGAVEAYLMGRSSIAYLS